MSGIIIAIFSYFLLAIVNVVDKFFVSEKVNPKRYSFYIGILGSLILILIPFGYFQFPGLETFSLGFFSGMLRIIGLFVFFSALKKAETSRIVPAVGAFIATFSLFFSFIVLGGIFLSVSQILALLFLIIGGILIITNDKKKIPKKELLLILISALLFSISFNFSKIVYQSVPFWSGLIMLSMGALFTSLFFLFSKDVRKSFKIKKKIQIERGLMIVFVLNQALSAFSFILLNWSIKISEFKFLSLINALEGIKYVFLLGFAVFFSTKFPKILKEDISKKQIVKKVFAMFLMFIGLFLLAFKF